jgi:hypothetical protein
MASRKDSGESPNSSARSIILQMGKNLNEYYERDDDIASSSDDEMFLSPAYISEEDFPSSSGTAAEAGDRQDSRRSGSGSKSSLLEITRASKVRCQDDAGTSRDSKGKEAACGVPAGRGHRGEEEAEEEEESEDEFFDEDLNGSKVRQCRICFEGEDEKGEMLRSNLCSCTGTMAYLHKSCLEKWIAESKTLTCEICKGTFALTESELEEWNARFEQTSVQHAFNVGSQDDSADDEVLFQNITNTRIRSCLQRTWRNRGAMNSSIIVLIGTSILVMMSLVLYHFLSPSRENVIAGALPPGQNFYEPFNCSIDQSTIAKSDIEGAGWLCGVPTNQISRGDCWDKGDEEPCGEWNQFTLLQSSIPRCFFGHGAVCYVALQPDPELGGACVENKCEPITSQKHWDEEVRHMLENGLLAQGHCVACV